MAKKPAAKAAPVKVAPAPEPVVETPAAPAPAVGARGPRGVLETAVINILTPEMANPKRVGSKAHDVFSKYVDGMTVGEFCDAAGKEATPNLVYDAAHGFISIEGYDPAVKFVPKEKAPKAAKEPKAKKAKADKAAPLPDPDEELDVDEEQVD